MRWPKRLLVLPVRIELTTSPLPRECSTTELRQRKPYFIGISSQLALSPNAVTNLYAGRFICGSSQKRNPACATVHASVSLALAAPWAAGCFGTARYQLDPLGLNVDLQRRIAYPLVISFAVDDLIAFDVTSVVPMPIFGHAARLAVHGGGSEAPMGVRHGVRFQGEADMDRHEKSA